MIPNHKQPTNLINVMMAQKKNILINIQTLFFLIHQNNLKTMSLHDEKKESTSKQNKT